MSIAYTQGATPEFDVISIKPMEGRIGAYCHGNRFVTGLPPAEVIRWAWQLGRPFLDGLPDWAQDGKQSYAIDARAPKTMTEAECRTMVQSLFASRFKMTSHREQRVMRGYALTAPKNGLKMRFVSNSDNGGYDWDSTPGVTLNGIPFIIASKVLPGVTMLQFAARLSGVPAIGLPVVDKTGLTGLYAFDLHFSVREDDGLPSIFTAVQEQLGLKLEPTKTPMEVLVVDHFERPTAN